MPRKAVHKKESVLVCVFMMSFWFENRMSAFGTYARTFNLVDANYASIVVMLYQGPLVPSIAALTFRFWKSPLTHSFSSSESFTIHKISLKFENMTTGHYICEMKRKIYREDILEAGRDLMFSRGYNDTSIKDITVQIGIPKGSFYNHFSSKEEFGLAVLQEYIENGLKIHQERLGQGDPSPLNRLIQFYLGMIEEYNKVLQFKLGCMF